MNISAVLAGVAEQLDLPEALYDEAVMRYTNIAEHLAETGTELEPHSPDIFPQGSFRLGTAIRPILHQDEFDIDLVCHLDLKKENVTQADLKEMVGKRLKEDPELAAVIAPSRRCWTLNFEKRFHMDVLPAIPNLDLPPTGILLTDRKLLRWQHSNPKAYADWFKSRMTVRLQEARKSLANSRQASIEEVPEWQVRTPLQRAVQLLKRHRDMMFQNQPDAKPVSIIITTLAAHAYRNQENLADALSEIARDMPKFIVKRDGKWVIENPVDRDENFADKWNEDPVREQNFRRWLAQVQQDFMAAAQQRDFREVTNSLSPVLGKGTMEKVAKSLGIEKAPAPARAILAPLVVPDLAPAPHCQTPPWIERLTYKATVSPTLHMKRNSRRSLWPYNSRPIPKQTWIKFTANTNVPAPYKIKWQVVNTGTEAHAANQPRGDFYESEYPENVRWESVAYAGTHWVEAFVIKGDACVARSGKTYVRVRK